MPAHRGILGNEYVDAAEKAGHDADAHVGTPRATPNAKVITQTIRRTIANAWWNGPHYHHSRLYWLLLESTIPGSMNFDPPT